MVKYMESELDATFGALADLTRRAILARLALGEASVGELAAPFEMSLPAVSKHLRVLEEAGFLIREKQGRIHRCRLDAKPMQAVCDWIEVYRRFWEDQLDSLAEYLEKQQQKDSDNGRGTDNGEPAGS